MPSVRLSKAQKAVLLGALGDSRIYYYYRSDSTMIVLARLGFASYHSRIGQKYGKSHWWITDAGIEQAKKII